MKRLIFIPLLLIILSCKTATKSNKQDTLARKQPAKNIDLTKNRKSENANLKGNQAAIDIIGIWALNGEENPIFKISKDSIYYPEHFVSYKYRITGDSIRIKYEDGEESFAFELKNRDTLLMKNMIGETVVQYRVK